MPTAKPSTRVVRCHVRTGVCGRPLWRGYRLLLENRVRKSATLTISMFRKPTSRRRSSSPAGHARVERVPRRLRVRRQSAAHPRNGHRRGDRSRGRRSNIQESVAPRERNRSMSRSVAARARLSGPVLRKSAHLSIRGCAPKSVTASTRQRLCLKRAMCTLSAERSRLIWRFRPVAACHELRTYSVPRFGTVCILSDGASLRQRHWSRDLLAAPREGVDNLPDPGRRNVRRTKINYGIVDVSRTWSSPRGALQGAWSALERQDVSMNLAGILVLEQRCALPRGDDHVRETSTMPRVRTRTVSSKVAEEGSLLPGAEILRDQCRTKGSLRR